MANKYFTKFDEAYWAVLQGKCQGSDETSAVANAKAAEAAGNTMEAACWWGRACAHTSQSNYKVEHLAALRTAKAAFKAAK